MKTFQFHPIHTHAIFGNVIKKAPSVCVKMLAKLLTTMAWAFAMIAIMVLLALMAFAKFII